MKIGRNKPCPCGSGKKYKKCCWKKSFDWVKAEKEGEFAKQIPLGDDAISILEEQKRKFVEKFGREPGPNDPVFFDAPSSSEFFKGLKEAAKKVGISPALVYATEKTGRMVTESNVEFLTDAEIEEWNDAIDEFEAIQKLK
jgi:hypothetical protein